MTTQVRQTLVLILMAKQKQPLLSEVQYLHMQSGTYFFGKKKTHFPHPCLGWRQKKIHNKGSAVMAKKKPTTAIFKS